MNSRTTHGFYVVHFQGGSYMHRNCVYIISGESNTVPLQPIMQLEIFWETLRTQLGALLS